MKTHHMRYRFRSAGCTYQLIKGLAFAAVFCLSGSAFAQARTTGPEGSEFGAGGYSGDRESDMSLSLQLGGAEAVADNSPLMAGLTLGFWADDWAAIEVSGLYLAGSEAFEALVGGRFRYPTYPLAPYAALRAGGLFLNDAPASDSVRFVVSPELGIDYTQDELWIFGLGAALDIPFDEDADSLARVFLNLGRRF